MFVQAQSTRRDELEARARYVADGMRLGTEISKLEAAAMGPLFRLLGEQLMARNLCLWEDRMAWLVLEAGTVHRMLKESPAWGRCEQLGRQEGPDGDLDLALCPGCGTTIARPTP